MDVNEFAKSTALRDDQVSEALYLVRSRGYAVVPSFYSTRICDKLKSELINTLDRYKTFPGSDRSEKDRFHIHDLMNHSPLFCRMLEDPRLQQLLAPLLGDFWIMYAFTSSSVPPRGINYGHRVHNDCPRFAPGYIFNMGLIWALDEFTRENGGTVVLPGSHHVEKAPSDSLFEAHGMQLTGPAGALILFDARMYHRSGENTTDLWRHSLTMNACRSYMKQRMDWVRMITPDHTDTLNAQARRIIGFDTRLPASMDEFFVPEEQRLYKPNQG